MKTFGMGRGYTQGLYNNKKTPFLVLQVYVGGYLGPQKGPYFLNTSQEGLLKSICSRVKIKFQLGRVHGHQLGLHNVARAPAWGAF